MKSFGISYLYLLIAIVSEVIATSAMKATHEFTKVGPTLLTAAGYISAFYFLSLTLRTIPVGIAYAIWGGVGIVLVCIMGMVLYGQSLDRAAVIGVAMIIGGVLVINLASNTLRDGR